MGVQGGIETTVLESAIVVAVDGAAVAVVSILPAPALVAVAGCVQTAAAAAPVGEDVPTMHIQHRAEEMTRSRLTCAAWC